MTALSFIKDLSAKKVAIIYKKSRYAYTQEKGSPRERNNLQNNNDPLAFDLIRAHENNLLCLEQVISAVKNLGLSYELISRADLSAKDITDQLVIAVGGDGTMLDASHYCQNAPILGVNSDPEQSVGALCVATMYTVPSMLKDIMNRVLLPTAVQRLSIKIKGKLKKISALNDVLYCHQNPAATSRYFLSINDRTESHRSSGVWVATPAGSTGAIYSCGAEALSIEEKKAIFHVREPFWANKPRPELFSGIVGPDDLLTIRSNMTDAHLFIDGPHKYFALPFGESVSIGLAKEPLWLFNGDLLNAAREKAIEQRRSLRRLP